MTLRHKVYLPVDDLFHHAHELSAPVVFDVAAGEAVCVVEDVEWRARLAVAS